MAATRPVHGSTFGAPGTHVEPVRWLSRAVIAVMAAVMSLGFAAVRPAFADANLQGLQITFVEPYGPHSVTNIPLSLMRSEITRKTGAQVEIVSVGGKAGGSALDYVIKTPPGGLGRELIKGIPIGAVF